VRVHVPIRDLAERHGIHPSKALGQNFLLDPNLARAIARDADVGPGTRVVEIGAGLGSLTVALAEAGASEVLAIEFDRALLPALAEVVAGHPSVQVLHADATELDWAAILPGEGWVLVANLPYNVGTSITVDVLEHAPVDRLVVMLQREVGERLVATPDNAYRGAYGAVSVHVAYRAEARLVRPVPPEVFWPRPSVGSVLVRIDRRAQPLVDVDEAALWRVVETSFAERRKTMRNAVRRLGWSAAEADAVLERAGISPTARPEELGVGAFARIVEALP
jgi:16S rRNA (adenine1518-N6/adenine1519-N6)-dimethyltransferase